MGSVLNSGNIHQKIRRTLKNVCSARSLLDFQDSSYPERNRGTETHSKNMGLLDTHVQRGTTCPRCIEKKRHGTVVLKTGRFGKFLGCDKYPVCIFTQDIKKKNLETEATRLLKSKRKITRRSKRKSKRLAIENVIERNQRRQRAEMFSDFKRLIAE